MIQEPHNAPFAPPLLSLCRKTQIKMSERGPQSRDEAGRRARIPFAGMKVDPRKLRQASNIMAQLSTFVVRVVPQSSAPRRRSMCRPSQAQLRRIQRRNRAEEEYTCPMHPEVKASGAGSCPKCGMGARTAAAPAPSQALRSIPVRCIRRSCVMDQAPAQSAEWRSNPARSSPKTPTQSWPI